LITHTHCVRKIQALALPLLVAACGSAKSQTQPLAPTPSAATTQPATTLTQPPTPLTPPTGTTTQSPVSCGSAGGATQITSAGTSCATAQQVATAYVHTVQGGQTPQGTVSLSVGGNQYTCTASPPSVTCSTPKSLASVVFRTS
jgi:hypothetical protein